MAVLNDWICAAHGKFTSFDGKCPNGCDAAFVTRMLAAPAMLSDRTKGIDKNLRDLASDFRMTNMTNRNGYVGMPDPASAQRVQDSREALDLTPTWGSLARGSENKQAIQQALAQHHVQPDNALAQVKESLTGPRPMPVAAFGSSADIKQG